MITAHRVALIFGALLAVAVAGALVSAQTGGTPAAAVPAQHTAFGGQPLYKTYCVTCHGASGKGDGPFAASMRKQPPDLTQLLKLNAGVYPEDRVRKAIDGRDAAPHGPSDMPVWGDAFSRTTQDNDPESVRQKIEALVKFIGTLQERPASE